jgi:hypothetical protein
MDEANQWYKGCRRAVLVKFISISAALPPCCAESLWLSGYCSSNHFEAMPRVGQGVALPDKRNTVDGKAEAFPHS